MSESAREKYGCPGLNNLAKNIYAWAEGKGFTTPTSLTTVLERDYTLGKLMLVVTELSEAAEAVRSNSFVNFKEEIADAVIRLLDISGAFSIDLETEIVTKMDFNEIRPVKHGRLTTL